MVIDVVGNLIPAWVDISGIYSFDNLLPMTVAHTIKLTLHLTSQDKPNSVRSGIRLPLRSRPRPGGSTESLDLEHMEGQDVYHDSMSFACVITFAPFMILGAHSTPTYAP